MVRSALAAAVGIAWMVTLPLTADALLNTHESWAIIGFVAAALAAAGLWWVHMRERARRIGTAGSMAGWLFIGSMALLAVSGFFWILVAMGLVASSAAYGLVLLVTQSRAATPRLDLATGLVLFATAGAAAIFTVTTGLGNTEAWWMPAHWILGLGLGAATVASGLPGGEAAVPAEVPRPRA